MFKMFHTICWKYAVLSITSCYYCIFRREAKRKGKAFNLHLSCYSLDRLTTKTMSTIQAPFSFFRGKDNLTSTMMGEVMRQVMTMKIVIYQWFSGFWKRWNCDHCLQFPCLWKISQWIFPGTGHWRHCLVFLIKKDFFLSLFFKLFLSELCYRSRCYTESPMNSLIWGSTERW